LLTLSHQPSTHIYHEQINAQHHYWISQQSPDGMGKQVGSKVIRQWHEGRQWIISRSPVSVLQVPGWHAGRNNVYQFT